MQTQPHSKKKQLETCCLEVKCHNCEMPRCYIVLMHALALSNSQAKASGRPVRTNRSMPTKYGSSDFICRFTRHASENNFAQTPARINMELSCLGWPSSSMLMKSWCHMIQCFDRFECVCVCAQQSELLEST